MSDNDWEPYEGPRDGQGWIHLPTDTVVYQDEKPDWDPTERDIELPPGTQRRQIIALKAVREYLHQRVDETGATSYSEYLDEEVLPEPSDENRIGFEDFEVSRLKVLPEVDEKVDALTGNRARKGEIIAFWALLDALDNGDYETVESLAEYVPELLWGTLEDYDNE